jgi:hypothetical protein
LLAAKLAGFPEELLRFLFFHKAFGLRTTYL